MSTRSMIGMVNENGAVTGIYCHWDGYPEHNGRILRDHYTTPAKIRSLLKLGDLSSLGPEIGKKHKFESTTNPEWCTAYKRDRREEDTDAVLYASVEEFLADNRGQDYTYLYVNSCWECRDYNGVQIDLYKMIEEAA
jgi:hypothetical protein